MGRLGHGPLDMGAVLAFLHDIYAVETAAEFPVRAMRGLAKLVGVDVITYNEIGIATGDILMVEEPIDSIPPEGKATFARLAPQHPLINHYARTQDTTPRKISDLLTMPQFHELELYQDFFRVYGLEHQMAVTMPSPDPVIGIALNRGRGDFSERDRSLLALIRSNLTQAHQNVRARAELRENLVAFERAAEEGGQAFLLVDSGRRVRLATPRAERFVAKYWKASVREGCLLPAALDLWIRQCLAASDLLAASAPLRLARDGIQLSLEFVRHGETGSYDAIVIKESVESWPISPRLTKREAEILELVASGNSNSQIAEQISVSPRTVQKHLEHVYDKLGVRRRTAAAMALVDSRRKTPAR